MKKKPLTAAQRKRELRKVLNVIEKALLSDTRLCIQLWDVLTALRGPDTYDKELKDRTTVPIRRAAFPQLAKVEDENGCGYIPASFSNFEGNAFDKKWADGPTHFAAHAKRAATALGLMEEN